MSKLGTTLGHDSCDSVKAPKTSAITNGPAATLHKQTKHLLGGGGGGDKNQSTYKSFGFTLNYQLCTSAGLPHTPTTSPIKQHFLFIALFFSSFKLK